jgi:glycosyltransferase involved in cell wall biosynthesis
MPFDLCYYCAIMKILVLIPAFNEASGIAAVIADIRRVVPEYDILVVNDGSSDDTATAAKSAGAIVISHPFNMRYGVTIQTGYKYAFANGYDYIVQIDADGQHDPTCIPDLLKPVLTGESDFALGSRFLGGGSYKPGWARGIGMAFFRVIVSWRTGTRITDSTSGFQAFNRDVILFFTSDAFPNDYPDADVLITLHLAGFRVCEVPVRMFSNSNGTTMHSGLRPLYYTFKMLLSIFVTLLRGSQTDRS